jgi:hypothetical protein
MPLTKDQIIDLLRQMPDQLRPVLEMADGEAAPLVRATLSEKDEYGNRLRLVCGIEFVGDEEDGGEEEDEQD